METKQMTMLSQYDIDKSRFIELFSKFTGISKVKIANFLNDNSINTIFEHPTAMDINESQREKIYQLRELKNLYYSLKPYEKQYKMDSTYKAGKYFREYFSGVKDKERFVCSFLDSQNNIITTKVMFTGTINEAPVYPREIAKTALLYDANSVILAHNHPGGSITPSQADINVTRKIVNALSEFNIQVIDHIIVGNDAYFSFRERDISLTSNSLSTDIRERIIEQYIKEYPAIQHITEQTAKVIEEINIQNGKTVTIEEIKDYYKKVGSRLEEFINDADIVKEFKKLENVVNDLKRAELTEKGIQSQSRNNIEIQANKAVEYEIIR